MILHQGQSREHAWENKIAHKLSCDAAMQIEQKLQKQEKKARKHARVRDIEGVLEAWPDFDDPRFTARFAFARSMQRSGLSGHSVVICSPSGKREDK